MEWVIQPCIPGFAKAPECDEHDWTEEGTGWRLCATCGVQAFFWRAHKPMIET